MKGNLSAWKLVFTSWTANKATVSQGRSRTPATSENTRVAYIEGETAFGASD